MSPPARSLESLLAQLDGSGSDREWAAVDSLRELPNLSKHLLGHFKVARYAGARAACVYHAARYAASDSHARALGLLALQDRSKVVRYRGALLLAIAQDPKAIPLLEAMAIKYAGTQSEADAHAAIAAIVKRDADQFVDRNNSGMVTLRIR